MTGHEAQDERTIREVNQFTINGQHSTVCTSLWRGIFTIKDIALSEAEDSVAQ